MNLDQAFQQFNQGSITAGIAGNAGGAVTPTGWDRGRVTQGDLGQVGNEAAHCPAAHEQDHADHQAEYASEAVLLVSVCGLAMGSLHHCLLRWRPGGPEQHDTAVRRGAGAFPGVHWWSEGRESGIYRW